MWSFSPRTVEQCIMSCPRATPGPGREQGDRMSIKDTLCTAFSQGSLKTSKEILEFYPPSLQAGFCWVLEMARGCQVSWCVYQSSTASGDSASRLILEKEIKLYVETLSSSALWCCEDPTSLLVALAGCFLSHLQEKTYSSTVIGHCTHLRHMGVTQPSMEPLGSNKLSDWTLLAGGLLWGFPLGACLFCFVHYPSWAGTLSISGVCKGGRGGKTNNSDDLMVQARQNTNYRILSSQCSLIAHTLLRNVQHVP